MITLAQVLFIPNAIVWRAVVIAGPGFFVGAMLFIRRRPRRPCRSPRSRFWSDSWWDLGFLALVLFGVALGVYLRLRKGGESLLDDLYQGGIAAVVIAAVYVRLPLVRPWFWEMDAWPSLGPECRFLRCVFCGR